MNLEVFLTREKEIENAIVNTNNQLNALMGHKAETQHWIQTLQNPSVLTDETKVAESVAPDEEVPVE